MTNTEDGEKAEWEVQSGCPECGLVAYPRKGSDRWTCANTECANYDEDIPPEVVWSDEWAE